MTVNIALINVHSSRNVGDAALTEVALAQLREHFPDSFITLVMNDPKSHQGQEHTVNSFYNWVYKYNKWQAVRFLWLIIMSIISTVTYNLFRKAIYITSSRELKETFEALYQANLVVSTPGGYLYSYGRGRALIMFSFTLTLAVCAGKPLYLLPQSIGPFKYQREYFMLKWALSRARAVMVREAISLEQLINMHIPESKCYLLPDMAFAFQGEPRSDGIDWLKAHGINLDTDRPLLGITVIDWGAQYQNYTDQVIFEEALAATIRHFLNHYDGKVILFPQSWGTTTNEDDRLPASRILSIVDDHSKSVSIVENPIPANLLKSIYGQMDLFIGTRMHSNIFAMSQGVPVIAIGYLHKTLGIAQTAGIENWVIDIHKIDDVVLINKLDELWAERNQVRDHLVKSIPILVNQTNLAGEIIAEDFAEVNEG